MNGLSGPPPAIVERVLALLDDAGTPLSVEAIAASVLHLAPTSGGPGAAILERVLGSEPRLERGPDGLFRRAAAVGVVEEKEAAVPIDVAVAVWAHLTGPRPPIDRILALAAVDRDGRVLADLVCDPGGPVHPDRLRGLGLRAAELDGAETGEEAVRRVADAVGEAGAIVFDRVQARALAPRIVPTLLLAPALARAGVTARGDTVVEAAAALGASWDGDPSARTLARLVVRVAAVAADEGLLATPEPELPRVEVPVWMGDLPEGPGVYRFLSPEGDTLYVGKARSIRSRVRTYFGSTDRRKRHRDLMARLATVRVEETGSEAEALLREAEVIREAAPPYNVQRGTGPRAGRLGDAVLFLPGTAGRVLCVLVVGGRVAARVQIGPGNRGVGRLDDAMRTYVFGDEPPPDDRGDGEILKTWLRREGDRVSLLDLAPVTSRTAARRLVRTYLADAEALGAHVVHR